MSRKFQFHKVELLDRPRKLIRILASAPTALAGAENVA
jgi:hypothetical protein